MKKAKTQTLNRRQFIKESVIGLAFLPRVNLIGFEKSMMKNRAKIALFKTEDRREGVRQVMKIFDFLAMRNKNVLIKPNFNTSDPTPGSTYNETLSQLIEEVRKQGASEIVIGERSGPPPTVRVLEEKGIFRLAQELNFKIINFEELKEEDWIHFDSPGNHWKNGFDLARPAVETEYFVSTCCLKTHQYGGVFTMSLKLAVGLTPKKLMRELHRSSHMRKMIAEINLGYKPQLIVLDGIEAFVDGGPMTGERKSPNLFLAGDDRVAVDAVGIAVLKELGSNEAIMGRKIFEQEQIMRAVELGLGISSPDQIEFITPDKESHEYAEKLKLILDMG